MRCIAMMYLATLCSLVAPAAQAIEVFRDDPPRTPAAAYAFALRTLINEAEQSWDRQQLVRSSANFASDFPHAIPQELVRSKLSGRVHERPFIDSYVRWQLTSLEGASVSPALNDRQFQKFLADLPKLIENPRADRELIGAIVAAARAGPLSQAQREKAERDLADLAERAVRAEAMNRPALELRNWVGQQSRASLDRALMVEAERAAALVAAGWPSDRAKAALDEACTKAAGEAAFTRGQRQAVVDYLRHFIGRRNVFIADARVQDDTIAIRYSDTGIYDFDVRRWANAILEAP